VLTLIVLMFFIVDVVEVPAVFYLGFWFVMQLMSGALALAVAGDAGGVAWWAHVGGFLAGMAVMPLLRRRRWSSPRVWRDQYAAW
jgi:membrane associated rhomboid family serine protease